MKTIITSLAIAALALLGTTPQAEARSHHSSRVYISGHRACGTPIYSERYFVGYQPCGTPIWRTRVVRHHYRPVVRPRYVAPCPPPYRGHARYDRGHHGTGFVIQGSFRR